MQHPHQDLKKLLTGSDSYWLSATDSSRERGDFVWPDMTPLAEDLWAPGYPNAFKEEEFVPTSVILKTNYFNLQDQKWYNKNDFFCVVPYELEACL
jgi:hypothetical protein